MSTKAVRIATTLVKEYEQQRQSAWGRYVLAAVTLAKRQEKQQEKLNAEFKADVLIESVETFKKDCLALEISSDEIINRGHSLHQDKPNFSWHVLEEAFSSGPKNFDYAVQNAALQHKHYEYLREIASLMVGEAKDDVLLALLLNVQQIKRKSTVVPSVADGTGLPIKEEYFSGGNVISDLFVGAYGMLAAITLAVGSLIYTLGALLSCHERHYYGTFRFQADMLGAFVGYLYKTVSAAVFPLSMVQSKYQTGSCNIFKGKRRRALDSLHALCPEANSEEGGRAHSPLQAVGSLD